MFQYEKIKGYLLAEIQKGEQGELLPSQTELTHKFKVNHLTVRKAWEELEREGLIYRVRRKGTFIKKVPSSDRRITFLVIVEPGWDTETGAWGTSVIGEIIRNSNPKNIALHIFPFSGNLSDVLKVKFQAIINVSSPETHYSILEKLKKKGYPVLVLNRVEDKYSFDYISTDHKGGARSITLYLLKKGHKRIGFVGLREKYSCLRQRYEGFVEALLSHRIRPSRKGVVEVPPQIGDNATLLLQEIGRGFRDMFLSYKPTAIVISRGYFVEAVLPVLRESGKKIPQDVDVATYDEVPDYFEEKEHIHEVIQPLREMGRLAVEEMEKMVRGEKDRVKIILPPSLRVKGRSKRRSDRHLSERREV